MQKSEASLPVYVKERRERERVREREREKKSERERKSVRERGREIRKDRYG